MATYGEGEPTDNAQDFLQWLQHNDGRLDNVDYLIFGCGNKTYELFNEMAKKCDRYLTKLGARRLGSLGLGKSDSYDNNNYYLQILFDMNINQ